MDEKDRVTHDQFVAYLAAKAPEKPCPECGVNDWFTSQAVGDDRPNPHLQVGIIPGAWTDKVMPVQTLGCRNCGYMKMFSAKMVQDWVRENG